MPGSRRAVLVSVVSWEERFTLGLQQLVHDYEFDTALLLFFEEWQPRTRAVLDVAREFCEEQDLSTVPLGLIYSKPDEAWRAIRTQIASMAVGGAEVVVDITTMPRETIWALFLLLQEEGASVRYAYHEPGRYGDWLSRDPEKPRLALKLSGETRFGLDTLLLVTTGFDHERTAQLIHTFEPGLTLLATQTGEQFDNLEQNVERHRSNFPWEGPRAERVQRFEIDAYDGDHGRGAITNELRPHFDTMNIVMASLGPKLSSVALYQIQREHPETALVYAPSREFNEEYSMGIGSTFVGGLTSG